MTSDNTLSAKYPFLQKGGEMGRLVRSYDWEKTPLGTPDTWPQSLRTTLGTILHSKFPMFLLWGEELTCFYNDAHCDSLGENGRRPHALGRPAGEAWQERWDGFMKPLTDHILSGGEATWHEDLLVPIHRNGWLEDAYWTFSLSPVHDESGRVAGVLGTCTETTEKVLYMRKLAESSDQLRFALRATELATWEYDPLTQLTTGNDRFREWYGLPGGDEAFTMEQVLAAIEEKDRQKTREMIEAALDPESPAGGVYENQYTVVNPDTGRKRIVLSKGRAWFDENRKVYRAGGTVQDVTQQQMNRQVLEVEKQRFLTLLETMPNMTWTTTPTGRTDFINKQWYNYTGLSEEQGIDEFWEDVIHPDDLESSQRASRQALSDGTVYVTEYRLRRADGTYRWHLARALPMHDAKGKISSWVGTLTDIHEQKQLEAKLDLEVKERTRQLEESVRDLKRSNENLQQFAYVASHDLQEPLRKIQSFGGILTSKYSEQLGGGADYLYRMQNAAGRMSVLIHDLLTYSRISTQQHNTATTVDLNKVLRNVLADLELRTHESGAEVRWKESMPTIRGDESQIRQLLQNLISNAVKFRRPDVPPRIDVDCRVVDYADLPEAVKPARITDSYYHITVADNGIGFEEQYLDRIFEVFQRLHGKHQYSGTGIGLAICEKVAANHGGAITASSVPGKGATFSVYLPV